MVSLRKAGLMSFAIGIIMLFAARYIPQPIYLLESLYLPQDQNTYETSSESYYVVLGVETVLIIAGAIAFCLGSREEKAAAAIKSSA